MPNKPRQGFAKTGLFIALNLVFAGLSGCSDSDNNNSTNTDIKAEFQGTWVAPAYGTALQIDADQARIYQYSNNYCLLEESFNGLEQSDIDAAYKLVENNHGDSVLELYSENGTREFHAPSERYQRQTELPESCQNKLIATHEQANYQADAERDFAIFTETLEQYSISMAAQTLDWPNAKQSAQNLFNTATDEAEQLAAYAQIIDALADVHTSLNIGEESYGSSNKPMLSNLLIDEYLSDNNLQAPLSEVQVAQVLAYLQQQAAQIEANIFDYAESPSDIHSAANDNFRWFSNAGLGYLNIATMTDVIANAEALDDDEINAAKLAAVDLAMNTALAELADTEALIVDIRSNPGGEDFVSLAILSHFIGQQQALYSKQARLGDNRSELRTVSLEPRGQHNYTKPIILIVSASTVSAAEVFALGMSSLEHVTIIGQSTQGALSDALEKELPNGYRFSLSNEYYLSTSGDWYEASGIPVDIEVDVFNRAARNNEQDPAIEAVLALLSD